MDIQYHYRKLTLDLTAGLADHEIEYQGAKIIYKSGTATLDIKLDDRSNDAIPTDVKDAIAIPYKKFYITAAATPETITLLLLSRADIAIESNETNVDVLTSITDPVKVEIPATLTTTADATATATPAQIAAANTGRKEIIIASLATNTVRVRIGESGSISATRGIPLEPGSAVTLSTSAAIFARADSGSQSLAICEVIR